nr:zinc finger, CCHC-type [Tanacetum cinerariifolium]
IVLSIEDKLNYLEQPIPPASVTPAGEHVAPEILVAHNAWIKGSKEIAGLMLMTMEPEHEEGQSVSSYVVKMKGYIDNLEHLRLPVTLGLGKGNKHKKLQSQMAVREKNHGNRKNKQAYAPKPEGLRASRKLKSGALSLYVGNGQREAVDAIGAFYLCLPGGLDIVLNNCHYPLSITRGVSFVSYLYEDGFVNRFVNNTIQVSRNNMVYFCAIPRDGIFEIDLSNFNTNESSIYDVSNKRAKLDLDSALLSCQDKEKATSSPSLTTSVKHKHEVFENFKVFQKEIENQLGKTIKSLRSDHGGEYKFLDHLKDHGIIAHRTPPYTPQHNGYPKETMGYSFYYSPENKVLVARNAEFLENSLINQEPSGSLEDLEIIQKEDTHPSIDTSLNHDEDDLEMDEPQSDIVPIRRSTRTRHAPNRICLYIDAEEHELRDLGEPANIKLHY